MIIPLCTDGSLRTAETSGGLERVCAFTLATALVWLGHDCAGGCPPLTLTLRARTWIDRTALRSATDSTTFVVFDLQDTVQRAVVSGMLREVNACTQPDHIRVQERIVSASPSGHWLRRRLSAESGYRMGRGRCAAEPSTNSHCCTYSEVL